MEIQGVVAIIPLGLALPFYLNSFPSKMEYSGTSNSPEQINIPNILTTEELETNVPH